MTTTTPTTFPTLAERLAYAAALLDAADQNVARQAALLAVDELDRRGHRLDALERWIAELREFVATVDQALAEPMTDLHRLVLITSARSKLDGGDPA